MDPVSLPPLRHLLSFPSFAIYESLEDHKVKVLDFFHSYCGQPLEKNAIHIFLLVPMWIFFKAIHVWVIISSQFIHFYIKMQQVYMFKCSIPLKMFEVG